MGNDGDDEDEDEDDADDEDKREGDCIEHSLLLLLLLLFVKLPQNKWWARTMLHNQSRSP